MADHPHQQGYKKLAHALRTCPVIEDVLDTFLRELGFDLAFLDASEPCDDALTKDIVLWIAGRAIGAVPTLRGGFVRREPTTRVIHGALNVECDHAGRREAHGVYFVFLEAEKSGVLKVKPKRGNVSYNVRFSALPPQTTFARGGTA